MATEHNIKWKPCHDLGAIHVHGRYKRDTAAKRAHSYGAIKIVHIVFLLVNIYRKVLIFNLRKKDQLARGANNKLGELLELNPPN